jgi:two-component system, NarL family, response regulator DevR
MTVRVLLVGDPVPAREVAGLLADAASLEIVQQAASAAEALVAVARQPEDVALLAWRLRDGDGLGLCRQLRVRAPGLRCLLATSQSYDDDNLFDAIMAGASGLVHRGGADLVRAVRIVGTGGSLLDQRSTAALLDRLRRERAAGNPSAALTGEERAVLALIADGWPNRHIAGLLGIEAKDVKTHVSHLMGKLGVQRRTQLATRLRRDQAG